MDSGDYTVAWIIYLIAAIIMTVISWRVMKKHLWRGAAYLLEGLLLAVLFTPWYVLPDEEIMAPAFIIFAMDTITINVESGIRALIPLVMAMLLALICAVILTLVRRVRLSRASR